MEKQRLKQRLRIYIYSCDHCGHAGSRDALRKQKQSVHEGIKFPCDQYEYAATVLSDMDQHKAFRHGGISYPCDQCEYAATTESSLNRHNQNKHKRIRYPCDQRKYIATAII